MQEVFEKVIEELEEEYLQAEKDMGLSDTYDEASHCGGRAAAYEKAQKIVKQEAEQYNNGWIPCSERLPEKEGKYLVTLDKWNIVSFADFKNLKYNPHFNAPVIAWQPLPAPYQPKGE